MTKFSLSIYPRICILYPLFFPTLYSSIIKETVLRSPEDLWTPDMFIVNEVKEPAVDTEHFVRISPGGKYLAWYLQTKVAENREIGEKNYLLKIFAIYRAKLF